MFPIDLDESWYAVEAGQSDQPHIYFISIIEVNNLT